MRGGDFTPPGPLSPGGLPASAAVGPRLLQRPGGLRELEARALDEAAAGRLRPAPQSFPPAEAAAPPARLGGRAAPGQGALLPPGGPPAGPRHSRRRPGAGDAGEHALLQQSSEHSVLSFYDGCGEAGSFRPMTPGATG